MRDAANPDGYALTELMLARETQSWAEIFETQDLDDSHARVAPDETDPTFWRVHLPSGVSFLVRREPDRP